MRYPGKCLPPHCSSCQDSNLLPEMQCDQDENQRLKNASPERAGDAPGTFGNVCRHF